MQCIQIYLTERFRVFHGLEMQWKLLRTKEPEGEDHDDAGPSIISNSRIAVIKRRDISTVSDSNLLLLQLWLPKMLLD